MGQQLNKVIKRKRRKAYVARKKERLKSGTQLRPAKKAAASTEAKKKPAAKKPAVKKAAPEAAAAETPAAES